MKSAMLIGIDEVGRGPLAGPIAFCAFKMQRTDENKIQKTIFKKWGGNIHDSKKLKESDREEIFKILKSFKKEKLVDYSVKMIDANEIDCVGLARATALAVARALTPLVSDLKKTTMLLDGGLKADKKYLNQQTIIKGDEKEVVIACASIIAKVTRDRLMKRLAKKYPEYGFEIHKGYGTKKHIEAIKKFGSCEIHRKSFLKNILVVKNLEN